MKQKVHVECEVNDLFVILSERYARFHEHPRPTTNDNDKHQSNAAKSGVAPRLYSPGDSCNL